MIGALCPPLLAAIFLRLALPAEIGQFLIEQAGRIVFHCSGALSSEVLKPLGIDIKDIAIVLVAVLIVFIISILNEKGVPVGERVNNLKLPVRWVILFSLIMFIVIFGAYGPGYIPVDPIYAEF